MKIKVRIIYFLLIISSVGRADGNSHKNKFQFYKNIWNKHKYDKSVHLLTATLSRNLSNINANPTKLSRQITLERIYDNMKLQHIIKNTEMSRGLNDQAYEDDDVKKTDLTYRYFLEMGSNNMSLFWDIDVSKKTIYFKVVAREARNKILAFGFSAFGDAIDADIAVIYLNHKKSILDCHSNHKGTIMADINQDYILDAIYFTEDSRPNQEGNNNYEDIDVNYDVIVEFHRYFDTCDEDDYVIDTGTTHIIHQLVKGGRSDEDSDLYILENGNWKMEMLQLRKSQMPVAVLEEDAFTFDIRVKNITIPPETTYWCFVTKLPNLREKHHIIKFEGVIQEKSIVHHLEVFHCRLPPHIVPRPFNAPCGSMAERPKGLEACIKVLGAWAIGANGLSYPTEAGFPIGGEDFNRYLMLEVHYNNVLNKTDIKDNSGLRFYVTRQLRQHDAATMELGLEYTDKMAIPPAMKSWEITGYCVPECTHVALPREGITVFASQLHTHMTGKRIRTSHYRDGVRLQDLNSDLHYSPHYQEIRRLQRNVEVLPGDALVTTCTDQTLERKNVTLGGFSTSDEMCVNYIYYYPATELEVCKSSVTTSSLFQFFEDLHRDLGQPTHLHRAISENYQSIDWSSAAIEKLQTFYEDAPISMQCNRSDGTRFPGDWEGIRISNLQQKQRKTKHKCKNYYL